MGLSRCCASWLSLYGGAFVLLIVLIVVAVELGLFGDK
jgi:hypothetical protein